MGTNKGSHDVPVNPYQSPRSPTMAPKPSRGLLPLMVSFLVISALGCAYIYTFWMNLSLWTGLMRCVGFVATMGGIHYVGYRRWKRQQEAQDAKTSGNASQARGDSSIWSREVPRALFWSVTLFVLFLLLWSLML